MHQTCMNQPLFGPQLLLGHVHRLIHQRVISGTPTITCMCAHRLIHQRVISGTPTIMCAHRLIHQRVISGTPTIMCAHRLIHQRVISGTPTIMCAHRLIHQRAISSRTIVCLRSITNDDGGTRTRNLMITSHPKHYTI